MTWAAWRLQRSTYLFFMALSALLIGFTMLRGLHIQSLRHLWVGPPCNGGNGFAAKYQTLCQARFNELASGVGSGVYVHGFALGVGVVLGLLLGVNVVAGEISHHTTRLAWTQSITRGRWFATKVAVALVSLALLTIPLGVVVSWFLRVSEWTPRLSGNGFIYGGMMPLATGFFAVAVGALVGTLLRHVGWSLAAGLIVVLVISWFVQTNITWRLVPLKSTTEIVSVVKKGGVTVGRYSAPPSTDSWVIFAGFLPDSYSAVPAWSQETRWRDAVDLCPSPFARPTSYNTCMHKLGLKSVQLSIPNSEYWTLQLREGGLYVIGAILFLGGSLAVVRRMRS